MSLLAILLLAASLAAPTPSPLQPSGLLIREHRVLEDLDQVNHLPAIQDLYFFRDGLIVSEQRVGADRSILRGRGSSDALRQLLTVLDAGRVGNQPGNCSLPLPGDIITGFSEKITWFGRGERFHVIQLGDAGKYSAPCPADLGRIASALDDYAATLFRDPQRSAVSYSDPSD